MMCIHLQQQTVSEKYRNWRRFSLVSLSLSTIPFLLSSENCQPRFEIPKFHIQGSLLISLSPCLFVEEPCLKLSSLAIVGTIPFPLLNPHFRFFYFLFLQISDLRLVIRKLIGVYSANIISPFFFFGLQGW